MFEDDEASTQSTTLPRHFQLNELRPLFLSSCVRRPWCVVILRRGAAVLRTEPGANHDSVVRSVAGSVNDPARSMTKLARITGGTLGFIELTINQ